MLVPVKNKHQEGASMKKILQLRGKGKVYISARKVE
jgi:hypothetical protein